MVMWILFGLLENHAEEAWGDIDLYLFGYFGDEF